MYKRIMVVVDTRPVARAAVLEGIALAKAHRAEMVFFSVLPRYLVPMADMPMFADVSPKQFEREAKASADRLLTSATAMAHKAGIHSRAATGLGEDPAKVIVEAARRRRCDLIVVASEGRNALLRLLTGSVIPGLITEAPMPVLVCKQRPAKDIVRAVPKKMRAATQRVAAPVPVRRARAVTA
jgi:nucleotide-binding universal stress UspA family protein